MTDAQAWVNAVCGVTGWDWHLKRNAGRAAKLGKELRAAGATVDELLEYFGQADAGAAWWWWRDTWQGRKGQRPTAGQVIENWGAWKLPIAVNGNGVGAMLAHIEELRNGNVHTT